MVTMGTYYLMNTQFLFAMRRWIVVVIVQHCAYALKCTLKDG
jgi:hypothetical protein